MIPVAHFHHGIEYINVTLWISGSMYVWRDKFSYEFYQDVYNLLIITLVRIKISLPVKIQVHSYCFYIA
jgi:hypothetical protein